MKIVNIGIVAHVDAGKTTLTEQLLYTAGELRKAGSVDSGTTQTDALQVERERGISVQSSSATLTWNGVQLNLIDTPGHVDFAAEVERSLSILDTAVLVISAVEGIQAQTEILYEALRQTHTNVLFFINKIDRVGSRVDEVLAQIREKFTPDILPLTVRRDEGEKTCSVALRTFDQADFADETAERLAEHDDALLERWLGGESLGADELAEQLRGQVTAGVVSPVLFGSGFFGVGVRELLDTLTAYGEPVKNNESDALSGVVYKITHDKTMGRIAHVRLFGGELHNRDSVLLSSAEEPQKVTQIRRYTGARFVDLGEAKRGDVVALCGLSNAKIADIVGEASEKLGVFPLSVPLLQVRVIPAKPEELYAVLSAFEELSAEDPHLGMEYNQDEKELTIRITGTIQLEILQVIVRQRYGLEVSFSAPTVIYKETPTRPGRGHDAYTMPKPCWAVITLDIEPLPRGSGLQFSSVVPHNQIFYKYQTHIETELPRALQQGIYNWEVVDLKVTLVGGGHHTIHTHPLDFFLATPLAVINGLQNTGTTLLEPLHTMRIAADEELVGKVIGDVIGMRGEYDSPVIADGRFTLEAKVPVSTSLDYAVRLASLSSGRAVLSTRFAGYSPCPLELGAVAKRRGVDPRDRDRWILTHRNAMRPGD